MNELKIQYKYDLGQHVYLIYDNEIYKGIINNLYITKKIVDPFDESVKQYFIDLLRDDGSPWRSEWFGEEELFVTQEDLFEAIKIK